MEHPRIDHDHVVDRYLAGRLSDADETAFEEHLFECADCLEQVESGEELRRGLNAVAAEEVARATVSLGVVAWLRARQPQIAALAGLCLVLGILPAVVLWQTSELDRLQSKVRMLASRSGLAEPTGAFQVVSLGRMRDGGGEMAEIRPDPDQQAVLLSLELLTVTAARYRVTLSDAGGKTLWTGDDLEPNLYDTLLVALPSSFLKPGSYRITIKEQSAAGGEPVEEMSFRVLPGQ